MSRPAPVSIAQIEWDFREVDADPFALPDATIWEYSRTSDRLRQTAVDWLDSTMHGKTMRQHVARGAFENAHTSRYWALRGHSHLSRLISQRGFIFPKPWTVTRVKYGSYQQSSVTLKTMASVTEAWRAMGIEPDSEFIASVYGQQFLLGIDWRNRSLDAVLKEVEQALRIEAKKHPERKAAGKAAQAPIEPLKWLAAYRLKLAGHTYDSARKLILPFKDNRIVPVFEDKSGWSDAIARARKHLAALEAADPE